ncbi:hypothetical protein [Thermus islandicus]|uniref:hypothetical protein n=1 Tax=Thermus islandicus TaxID=540988 RepID=UPI00048C3F8C|nr:hypothetical protein [Thermus islandicus]
MKPRQVAVTAGFLLLALYDRNPLLLNTGHVLVPALLLLSAFLPLQGSFGWEAALTKGLPQPGVAWGLLPFLVMGFFAYFLNAVIKDFHGYFVEGSAAFYALRSYGTDLGYALSFLLPKEVLVFLSRYVYVVEASAPFLLLLPLWELRLLGTLLLMSLRLGFFLLDIGNFPWVMLAFLALFLPSPFLDGAGRAWRRLWRLGRVRIHYDGGCGFCARVSQALGVPMKRWVLFLLLLPPLVLGGFVASVWLRLYDTQAKPPYRVGQALAPMPRSLAAFLCRGLGPNEPLCLRGYFRERLKGPLEGDPLAPCQGLKGRPLWACAEVQGLRLYGSPPRPPGR